MEITESFNKNVLTEEYLKKHLSKKDYVKYKSLVENRESLNIDIAEKIAKIMKKWAIEMGAKHFSNWFQPLTGRIAEKQTSFISIDLTGKPIVEFSSSALINGEVDASSFPNGGLRSIFEARGLISWDYTYPVFIKETSGNKVLCIPTVLKSVNGESLDKRRPLLNSCEALNKQVLRLLKLFGDTNIKETFSVVGIEQEYFLIKKEIYDKREDLKLLGRTLFGKELIGENKTHYMGSISKKTGDYMNCVEEKLWELGIPAQVKHNEVAPRQYEIVPHFENIKIAANHDFLTMEILEREAKKFGYVCLLDEKPFKGLNGSGKHNNWSIITSEGKQLFSYGTNPKENARFLIMIIALMSALDKHSDLIRATVATSNNDNRLSGHEAPSSIVSLYLGKELTEIFEKIVNDNQNNIKLGETLLPLSRLNISDRNRTSPFAFLGNRFEFRMPGASSSIAVCNTALNTIMAESLSNIVNQLENSKDFYSDLKHIIVKLYKQHSRIIYNGNSYTKEWEDEAKNRGLKNIKNAPEAFKAFITEDSIKMFEEFNVYKEEELYSRYNIKVEKYIEDTLKCARVMKEIVYNKILPQVIKYIYYLNNGNNSIKFIEEMINEFSNLAEDLNIQCDLLKDEINKTNKFNNIEDKANYCIKEIKVTMNKLREIIDNIEEKLPSDYWPIPTYSDLLN